jgi:AraC family transcriptional regulator
MNQEPEIVSFSARLLVGKKLRMTYSNNLTLELWRDFMPHRNEIANRVSQDLFSLQEYSFDFDFSTFDPEKPFDKWAAAEVKSFEQVPAGMECFIIPAGIYAVFHFKGPSNEALRIFGYIFGTWLPFSPYNIDNRPHFEILGPKYKNNDPDSEEEIWIPIRPKTYPKV